MHYSYSLRARRVVLALVVVLVFAFHPSLAQMVKAAPLQPQPSQIENFDLASGFHPTGEPTQQPPGGADANQTLIIGILSFLVFQSLIIFVLGLNLRDLNRTEKALRLSEERWQFALEGSGDGVWDWDFVTNTIAYSPRYMEMLGYEPHEFTNTVEEWSGRLHPDDRDRALEDLEMHRRGEKHTSSIEFRMRAKDGSYRWILGRGKIIARSDDGTPIRMVGTNTDITQRKWAEEEIRKINTTLEQRVKERTAQLEAANRELEAFSYTVSHDLRAPLRAIDALSRLLSEDYREILPDDGIQSLNSIRDSSRQMAGLIDDLLGLSQISRTELKKETIDLANMARQVAGDLTNQQPGREVAWVIPGSLPVNADPRLARILLTNLLHNAWKFTAPRGTAQISLGVEMRDGKEYFFVRDNGVGFDMANAAQVFEPFTRLHPASEFEGTGIGLATVHRIVLRHGGKVWAESAPDQGTTIFFSLAS